VLLWGPEERIEQEFETPGTVSQWSGAIGSKVAAALVAAFRVQHATRRDPPLLRHPVRPLPSHRTVAHDAGIAGRGELARVEALSRFVSMPRTRPRCLVA